VTASVRFAAGASSHAGMVRPDNEDAFIADDGVFLVADGMGGHQAGEVASALAVDTLREAKARGLTSVIEVERSVRDANSAIRHHAAETIDRAGMGTTLTGFVVLDAADDTTPQLAVTNVGDSRTYLFRDRRLVQLTVDHSYVQELVRTGQITEQEARFHPRRNIVTRALGIDHNVAVDAWVRACVRGDRYLVCSDGLVDEVPDHEIEALLDGVTDPQVAADQLVQMANRHGGRDNVTVIVVDVIDGLDAPPADDVMPAGNVDDGDLPGDVRWADSNATQVLPATAVAPAPAPAPRRGTSSAAVRPERRFGLPQLLFVVALGAILTVVVVVIAVAVQSEPDPTIDPPATVAFTTTPVATTGASTVTTDDSIDPTTPVTAAPLPPATRVSDTGAP
jgi:serine/threonine protein phosphatase PrpC